MITSGGETLTSELMPAQDDMQNYGWEQAWIEIVDTIGPLFPAPPDT